MDKDINLVELLKNAPKGIRLWSPICGVCELFTVNVDFEAFPIVCIGIDDGLEWHFKANGAFTNNTGVECLLFPSRENRDWTTFHVETHKSFKPYQKVLVQELAGKYCEKLVWMAAEYSHFDEDIKQHYCTNGYGFTDDGIMSYEGNEDRLGKTAE